jgi:serine/threonine protein phosphatase PrpC
MLVEQDRILAADGADDEPIPNYTNVVSRAVTHRGLVRKRNDDSFCAEMDIKGRYLLAVADGLGGHKSGSVASKMALEAVRREFHGWWNGSSAHFVGEAIKYANQEVFSAGHMRNEFSQMKTTVTAVVMEHNCLTVGHVGDCRLYRVRDGVTELLTRDHTMASDLIRLHLISSHANTEHPERHQLTRSVGAGPFLRIDVFKKEIRPGDAYLLCTDGLWSKMTLDDVRDVLACGNPEAACKDLMGLALKDGAPDNITAIVFQVESVSRRPSRTFSWRTLFRASN